MKKIIVIAAIAVMAMAVPAMAHGVHNGRGTSCSSQCTRTCTQCGGAVRYGLCTKCGADQCQYNHSGHHSGQGTCRAN